MKLDGMKPAPPVTRTRLATRPNTSARSTVGTKLAQTCGEGGPTLCPALKGWGRVSGDPLAELALDRVQRAALDLPLDAAEVLAHEREDEPLDPEHEQDQPCEEQRPREVRPRDPVDDPPDRHRGRSPGAEHPQQHTRPLNRLRPEAGEHVQGEARQA